MKIIMEEKDLELIELIKSYYMLPYCGVGGPLHITTDDLNCCDESLDFCEEECKKMTGWCFQNVTPPMQEIIKNDGLKILSLLREYSEAERILICEARWK